MAGWGAGSIAARRRAAIDRRDGLRRAALVAIGVVPVVSLVALAAVTLTWGDRIARPFRAANQGWATGLPLAPRPTAGQVRSPAPRAITLETIDLPSGYHVVREAPAAFGPAAGQGPPASWDVVFAPDAAPAAGGQLIESLAVVYPTVAAANAALDQQDASEQSARAVPRNPTVSLGDRETVWVEPAADRPGYQIVRFTWRSLNVVAQVSALGPGDALNPDRIALLASAQQRRIASPAPAGTA